MWNMVNICCSKRDKGLGQIEQLLVYAGVNDSGIEYTEGTFNYCPYCGTRIENEVNNEINQKVS